MPTMLPWGSDAERERAQRIAAKSAAPRCRSRWARRARAPLRRRGARRRPRHRPHALRRGARRADGGDLLRLGPGADRPVWRAAREERRRGRPRARGRRSAAGSLHEDALHRRAAPRAAAHPAAALVARPARAGLPRARRRSASASIRGSPPEKALWVHAVSVGEARAAAPLVRALQGAARPRGGDDLHHRGRPRDAEAGVRRVGARRLPALRLSGGGAGLPRALPRRAWAC